MCSPCNALATRQAFRQSCGLELSSNCTLLMFLSILFQNGSKQAFRHPYTGTTFDCLKSGWKKSCNESQDPRSRVLSESNISPEMAASTILLLPLLPKAQIHCATPFDVSSKTHHRLYPLTLSFTWLWNMWTPRLRRHWRVLQTTIFRTTIFSITFVDRSTPRSYAAQVLQTHVGAHLIS